MEQIKDKRTKYFILAFLIMTILFISSSMTYTEQTSVPFLEKYFSNKPFYDFLRQFHFTYAGSDVSVDASGYFKFVEFFIRKGAHFSIYFILGMSWFLALQGRIKNQLLLVIIPVLLAGGYAGFDEFHQSLTGGRSPLIQDVILDSFGSLVAVIICLLVYRYQFKKREPTKIDFQR